MPKPAFVKILASTFGTLALFHVESGAKVASGDRICEIEAMKTFYSVESPISGTLTWRAILGEVVNTGDWLASVETGETK